jgi:2-C-methyl-D-erythritol 4-phosphate cytidylyltransferase
MSRYFALIPAAGTGSRMGRELPKQYLSVLERPLLHHAIARMCACASIERVFVVLAPHDRWFGTYDWAAFGARLVTLPVGGRSRAESVCNGLARVANDVAADDWVLVHDAARPCLSRSLLERLLAELSVDDVGGLLAMPLADTLKRGEDRRVLATEPRAGLWQAQTPQMFRHGLLQRALQSVDLESVTDESSAVESLGLRPRLVLSDATNLKVTYPRDLVLAELILASGALAA